MTTYRVIFQDPDDLEANTQILIPSGRWLKEAQEGKLPPLWVHWKLAEDEQKAIDEGRHESFAHDPSKLELLKTAPRIGKLTEKQAMEYLIMKELPRRCWAEVHNRPMFRIVKTEQVPSDRTFRDAWEMI
jgi:hypothetical protein